jgi:hypothetical protein
MTTTQSPDLGERFISGLVDGVKAVETPGLRQVAEGGMLVALIGYGVMRTLVELAPGFTHELAERTLNNIQG